MMAFRNVVQNDLSPGQHVQQLVIPSFQPHHLLVPEWQPLA